MQSQEPSTATENPCVRLGIPTHLHQDGRAPDSTFPQAEGLFRRFRPDVEIVDGKPPATIFEFRRMSVARSGYCQQAKDVLYDDEHGQHMFGWGVVEITVGVIESLRYTNPVTNDQVTFKLRHDPKPCMYPHSEVDVLVNGEPVAELKTRTIRLAARDYLAQTCCVRIHPTQP